MAAFELLVAAAWALLVTAYLATFMPRNGPLLFAIVAGTGRRMLGVPVSSNHYSSIEELLLFILSYRRNDRQGLLPSEESLQIKQLHLKNQG